jgi:hypothetical protein
VRLVREDCREPGLLQRCVWLFWALQKVVALGGRCDPSIAGGGGGGGEEAAAEDLSSGGHEEKLIRGVFILT